MVKNNAKMVDLDPQIIFPYDPRYLAFPVPSTGVFDAPTFWICVNQTWWAHISGVMDRLLWADAWVGTDDEIRDAIDGIRQIMSAVKSGCPDGDMFRLRQSTTNPCKLEQSTDGGETWSLAFDYSLCSTDGGGINIDIDAGLTYIDDSTNIYNGDPSGFESDLQDLNDPTNAAVCYALEIVIRGVLAAALERKRGENRVNLLANAAAGALAIVAAFTFGSPLIGTATAIGVAVALIAQATVNSVNEGTIEDVLASDALIRELVCCAYDALVGTRPTAATFETAWGTCSGLPIAAAGVVPILQEVAEDLDTFVQFLRVAGQAWTWADRGLLGDGCLICDQWDRCWLGGKGFVPAWALDEYLGATASYNSADDRVDSSPPVGNLTGATVDMSITVNETITYAEFGITYNATRSSASDFIEIQYDGVVVKTAGVSGTQTTQIVNSTPAGQFVGVIRLRGAVASQSAGDAAYLRVTDITINGTGSNPFGSDNCD